MIEIFSSRKQALIASIALLFVSAPAFGQTGPAKGNLHVFAVGIDNPVYMKPERHLHAAHKDAQDHVQFWRTQGKLFASLDVPPALINNEATAAAILHGLDAMIERCRPGDTAIVPMSAHGGCAGNGEWALCAFDRPLLRRELAPRIERLAKKGVRVLLIVDTCESGAIGIQGDNIIVLAACTADQNALENGNNGFFTQAMIEGLKGAADANKDGVITLAELDAYISVRIEALGKNQSSTCGRPANIRSSLPLATVVGAAGPFGLAPNNGPPAHAVP
jgi:hypothetical protein